MSGETLQVNDAATAAKVADESQPGEPPSTPTPQTPQPQQSHQQQQVLFSAVPGASTPLGFQQQQQGMPATQLFLPWPQQPTYLNDPQRNGGHLSPAMYPQVHSPNMYAGQSPAMYSAAAAAAAANPKLLHPGHHHMVQGFVSPVLGPADWHAQFLQAASLQKLTAGFLSPAVRPPAATFSPQIQPEQPAAPPASPSLSKSQEPATPSTAEIIEQQAALRASEALQLLGGAYAARRGSHQTGTDASNQPEGAWHAGSGECAAKQELPAGPSSDPAIVASAQAVLDFLASHATDEKPSTATHASILYTALALLGQSPYPPPGREGMGGSASVKLVHPDDFKNPSTFLKIYGDPLCFSKVGPLPRKDRNGNWECSKCHNVNFPRRFRCNVCMTLRDANGDWVVSAYARHVYERYVAMYRTHEGGDVSVPVPDVQQRGGGGGNGGGGDLNLTAAGGTGHGRRRYNNKRRGGGGGGRGGAPPPQPAAHEAAGASFHRLGRATSQLSGGEETGVGGGSGSHHPLSTRHSSQIHGGGSAQLPHDDVKATQRQFKAFQSAVC